MKRVLAVLFATMLVGQAWATKNYDFKSEMLYYKIVDQSTVQLVGSDTYKKLVSVIIPETVTYKKKNYTVVRIDDNAFSNCRVLEYVSIPVSVISIGGNAFEGCAKLKKAEFASVESLCQIKFTDTKMEETKQIQYQGRVYETIKSTKNVNSNPLFYAHHLYINGKEITDLIIPKGVTNISNRAFCGCSSITSVIISESVISIGNYAFEGCTNLVSVTIPNSITSIGAYAFSECTELVSINIPNTVSEICDGTFRKCSKLESVSIPNSISKIGYSAFYGCENLIDAAIPNSVKEIGVSAFGRCKIQTLDIPSSVEKIGDNAFISCLDLTQVKIPASVKIMGKDVLSNCLNLKNVYCEASEKPDGWDTYWIADKQLSKSFSRNEIIKWGNGENAEKSSTVNEENVVENLFQEWVGVSPERYYDFSAVCSSGQTLYFKYMFNPKTVRICMPMWYPDLVDEYKTYGNCEKPKGNLIIPETVTYEGKTYIVTEISNKVFYNSKGLTSVTIPTSINSIGSDAFAGCDNLTSVTINSEAQINDAGIYLKKGQLWYYVLDKSTVSVVSDGNQNYAGDIVIPSKITAGNTFSVIGIGGYAFAECIDLKSVTIPNTIKTIGENAFRSCIHLTAIYCQAKSEPFGWNANWNPNKYKVVWGAIDKFK
ncbi:MAG: leucine-rich repeat domain-containing protein [Salinivirgaceae bacterium]|nr:leucine-rich repeat domain-containing protein [Salinivirgaceae bacterium]